MDTSLTTDDLGGDPGPVISLDSSLGTPEMEFSINQQYMYQPYPDAQMSGQETTYTTNWGMYPMDPNASLYAPTTDMMYPHSSYQSPWTDPPYCQPMPPMTYAPPHREKRSSSRRHSHRSTPPKSSSHLYHPRERSGSEQTYESEDEYYGNYELGSLDEDPYDLPVPIHEYTNGYDSYNGYDYQYDSENDPDLHPYKSPRSTKSSTASVKVNIHDDHRDYYGTHNGYHQPPDSCSSRGHSSSSRGHLSYRENGRPRSREYDRDRLDPPRDRDRDRGRDRDRDRIDRDRDRDRERDRDWNRDRGHERNRDPERDRDWDRERDRDSTKDKDRPRDRERPRERDRDRDRDVDRDHDRDRDRDRRGPRDSRNERTDPRNDRYERRSDFNPKLSSDDQFPSLGSSTNLTKKELKQIQEKDTGSDGSRRGMRDRSRRNKRRGGSRPSPRPPKLSEYIPGGKNGSYECPSSDQSPMPYIQSDISIDAINNAAIGLILDLDSKGRLVTAQDVVDGVCQQFGKTCLEEFGLTSAEEISCVKKLIWKQEKINAYLHSYDGIQAIGTLHDLSMDLAQLFEKQQFSELRMGPLLAQPELWKIFTCGGAHVNRIPEITTSDVMLHLRNFMDKSDLWKKNVDISEFKQYLSQQYNVVDPEGLGIRIRRLGLAISVIRKAKDAQRLTMDKMKAQFIRDFEQMFEEKLRHLKGHFEDSLAESASATPLSLTMDVKRQYMEMDAVDVLMDILRHCDELFINHQLKYLCMQFLTMMQHDQLARKMFQLALCAGKLDKPEDLVPKHSFSVGRQASSDPRDEDAPSRPTEDQVVRYLRDCLEKCSGHLSLKTWCYIEDNITSHFSFSAFKDLGHGTFLHFLQSHSEILEEYGMASFLVSSCASKSPGQGPSRQELEDFIRQYGFQSYDRDELAQLTYGIKVHYQVDSVTALGHGSLIRLVDAMKKEKTTESVVDTKIYYEEPFTSQSNTGSSHQDVGLLGSIGKDQAIAVLKTTPLLEDLSSWSHWPIVFQPQFGSLKPFIKKYSGKVVQYSDGSSSDESEPVDMVEDLIALETEPGKLLRITANTSARSFANAINKLDSKSASGHLVSIIIKDGGIQRAPISLMTKYVKTILEKVEKGTGGAGDSRANQMKVSRFVQECLMLLPSQICQAVGRQVYLGPLGEVLGKTKAETSLLETCQTDKERLTMEKIGMLLGITDWYQVFESKACAVGEPSDHDISSTDLTDDLDGNNPALESIKEDLMLTQLLGTDCGYELKPPGGDKEESEKESEQEVEDEESEDQEEVEAGPSIEEINEKNEGECEVFVNDIRQTRFGIGLDLDDRTKEYTSQLMELIGRSLETLSKELYNKDTHFVLELIQNADDNAYDDGHEPALVFVVEESAISLYNNEVGFWNENIDAVCNVRKSTKLLENGKHKQGYIGQKGIGFKSVFTVTDMPEIHSNGFHIRFDAKNETSGVGYILPHWIPAEDRVGDDAVMVELKEINNEQRWNTKIFLPLKAESEREKHRSRSLTASFHDIHPSLLLFLHRLKRITIINKAKDETLHIVRRDKGDGVVEVTYGERSDQWLVVWKSLVVSEEMNPDVATTELALAFPIPSKGLSPNAKLPKQDVFAFLPLRSFGFNFIVQGDFEIPSSRQDLHHNNHWNQWLRSEVPGLFVEALDSFRAYPEFTDIQAVCAYLKFVPLEGEIIEFFQPIVKDIMKRLTEKEWLPVAGGDNDTVWKQPSEIVICNDALLKEVITPELLNRFLGWYYIHDQVPVTENLALFSSLGVHTLEAAHVLEVFRAVVQEAERTEKAVSAKDLHLWFVCLYQSMDQYRTSGDVRVKAEYEGILEALRSLSIIPLSDGSTVALRNKAIFFSDKNTRGLPEDITSQVLETDLLTVHQDLFTDDEDQNSKVRMLLKGLGVKDIMPNEVIEKHIFPVLETDIWKDKNPKTLIAYIKFVKLQWEGDKRMTKLPKVLLAYTTYIKQQWERDRRSVDMSRFRAVARVKTNKGFVTPATEAVHFTVDYLNKYDLPQLFPGYDWVLLDSCYIQNLTLKTGRTAWRAFFDNLGVTDFLKVKREKVILKPEELPDNFPRLQLKEVNTAWAMSKDQLPASITRLHIEDFICQEFMDLVHGNVSERVKITHMKNAFLILDKYWESHYENYVKSTVTDENGKFLKEVDSSFFSNLKEMAWIPVTKVGFSYDGANKNVLVSEEKVLVKSCDAYIASPFIQNLVGLHVPLVLSDLPKSGSFTRVLGIRMDISVNEVKNLLVTWCTGKPVDDNANIKGGVSQLTEPRMEFFTSLDEIKNVYKFLQKMMDEDEFRMLFDQYPALFIPVTKVTAEVPNPGTVVTKGMFYYVSEACWHDPTKMFGKYRPSFVDNYTGQRFKRLLVRAHYQEIESIFCHDLGLAYTPTIDEYVLLLEHIASLVRLPDREGLEDVFSIYQLLGEQCVKVLKGKDRSWQKPFRPKDPKKTILDEGIVHGLCQVLQGKRLFPTKNNKWVCLEDRPMIADDKRLAEIFIKESDNCQVNFIQFVESFYGRELGEEEDDDPRLLKVLPKVFFHAIGIQCLSDCVETKTIAESTTQCSTVHAYVQKVVPFIQLLMLSRPRLYRGIYEQLSDCKIHQQLKSLQFLQAKKIEVVFTMRTMPNVCITKPMKANLCMKNNTLYVQEESITAHHLVNREIMKLFLPPGNEELEVDVCNFLTILSTCPNPDSFMEYQGLITLPSSETAWVIPGKSGKQKASKAVPPPTDVNSISADINWTEEDEYMRTRYSHKNKGSSRSWAPSKSKGHESEEPEKLPEDHAPSPPPNQKRPLVAVAPMPKITATVSVISMKEPEELCQKLPHEVAAEDTEEFNQARRAAKKHRHIEAKADEQRSEDEYSDDEERNQRRPKRKSKRSEEEGGHSLDGGHGKGGHGSVLDWVTGSVNTLTKLDKAKYVQNWSKIEDIPFEPLPEGVQYDLPILPDQCDRSQVGRWGEQWAYDYLCHNYREEVRKNYLQITWLNQKNETGSPYDIKLEFANGHVVCIEVKSTQSVNKDYFEISPNEVELAKKMMQNYHIYRLYNAGSCKDVKLKILRNAVAMMDMRTVILLLQL